MDYRALVQKLGDRTNQNTQTSELILEHRTGHPNKQDNNTYHNYDAERWDALTDGMEGDYPGSGVDYDLLGF